MNMDQDCYQGLPDYKNFLVYQYLMLDKNKLAQFKAKFHGSYKRTVNKLQWGGQETADGIRFLEKDLDFDILNHKFNELFQR
ncbi:hypothetical protein OENOO_48021 [Oenococcus oeni ATCC BAA-1163]|uniref:Uncharacterized protein n=1 Tax=Oenococcus oeni ATCC BAA-1163 TaxID=379360 RepID=A0NIF2_OENOE|nr:hypothetical protein OENOO_48021 [Oenococcus oeni ATCC BAA-1163]